MQKESVLLLAARSLSVPTAIECFVAATLLMKMNSFLSAFLSLVMPFSCWPCNTWLKCQTTWHIKEIKVIVL